MTDKCQLCKRDAIMRLVGRWPRCTRHASARIGRKHVHEKPPRKRNHRGQVHPERSRRAVPRAVEYDADHIGAGRTAIDQSGGALGRMKPGNEAVYVCELCPEVGPLTLVGLRAHFKGVHSHD